MDEYIKAAQLLDAYYENNFEAIKRRRRYSDEQLTKIYSDFYNLYSPEKLLEISEYEVLDKVFDDRKNEKYGKDNSLVYKLKQEGPLSKYDHLGHIASQYSNHLAIYRSGKYNWKTGLGIKYPKEILNFDEASAFASDLLTNIINVIHNNPSFSSLDDYQCFSKELAKVVPVHSWLHKYLHMIMPDSFPQFHTHNYKIAILNLLDIKPINKNDDILLAGQLEKVFHNMKHYHFYEIPCLFYTIPGITDCVKNTKQSIGKIKNQLVLSSQTRLKIEPAQIDYSEEVDFQLQVQKEKPADITNAPYVPVPIKKTEPVVISKTKKYQRNPAQAKYALVRANNKCEYMSEHWTFTRSADNLPYTEAHHLIPMEYQDLFENLIDVPANIISLCSSCHNCVHYGVPAQRNIILKNLYESRKDELLQAGINISFDDLVKMYE